MAFFYIFFLACEFVTFRNKLAVERILFFQPLHFINIRVYDYIYD